MANREYEMLFKLGAQLGQNFTGTFNSAQQVLQTTQKKIQELNKLQSNVDAYQRQQSGIEKTSQKLEMYKTQLGNTRQALDVVRKEIQANGGATAELAAKESDLVNKELTLQNRIRDTENALNDKNNRLRQMGQSLNDAGVNTAKLTTEADRLGNELVELRGIEEQAAKEADNFGNSGLAAFDAVGSAVVASGIAVGLKKIAEAYAECVNVSMEFESTMSTVKALSSANANEMALLSAEAKRLGAETVFTANESAQAMTYMGMAGWEAQEMLNGMNGVMSLAAASGEDLALVSDIVTDNLTAFGLTAKDTARFADVLAAAATNSNTSVSIMGETFSGSAAIAGALGYSIEDVATAVGLMANAGVKGSVAGTALKNMFNGLLNGATLTSKAFGEVEFSAVNADGTIDSFSESMNELRVYFDQMTEAERVQNAEVIAGMRGYNGLLAIINSTESDYNSLAASINNCSGAAEKMADIKLDNLQGDVTLLESATDGLKMTIGGLYRDELRRLVQIGTTIISGINDFCEKNPIVVKGILSVVAGIGTMLTAYKGITAAKKIMNTVTTIQNALTLSNVAATNSATAAQVGLNTAMSASPVGFIVAGLGALTGIVASVSTSYESLIPNVEELTEKAREFDSAMEEAKEGYNDTSASIAANIDVSEMYISKLEEIERETNGNVSQNEEYHNVLALLSRTIPEVAQYIDLETNSIQGGTEALRDYVQAYREKAEEEARQDFINSIYDEYNEVIKEVTENKIKLTQAQIKEQQSLDNAAQAEKRMAELYAEAEKRANGQTDAASFLGDEYFELQTAVGDYYAEAEAARKEQESFSEAIEKGNKTLSEAEEMVNIATETVNSLAESNKNAADESTDAYNTIAKAIENVSEKTQGLVTAYNDAYQAAYDSVSGQYNLWTKAEEAIPTSIDTINNALGSQQSYWDKYGANLEKLLGKTEEVDGLREVLASFADGSKDSVNAIAGMAEASGDELKKMVDNYRKTQEEEEKVAGMLAEVKVDFEDKLGEINETLEASIDQMNMSDEAEAAAKATIEAYAQAIANGRSSVSDAVALVQKATTAALAGVQHDGSPEVVISGGMVSYYGAGAKYASGTDYAKEGVALVGEQGPELVHFRGGEKVYTADETKGILGGSTQITISPSFVVNGNADQDSLKAFSDELIEMVMDALSEAGIDHRRSAYA